MIGVIANAAAIMLGGVLGCLIGKGISEKISDIIMKSMALSIMIIGLQSALSGNAGMKVVLSMIVGAIIGTVIDIDKRLNDLGIFLEKKFSQNDNQIAKGFVMSSLIFCIGSMAVVGALRSGLLNDNEMLFIKAVLDGITGIILASTYGFGVVFSAIAVLVYEGLIYFLATFLKVALQPEVVTDVSVVGGILIVGLAFNILLEKELKIANMLPALFIPIIYNLLLAVF